MLDTMKVSHKYTYQEFFEIFIVGYDAIVDNNKFCMQHTNTSIKVGLFSFSVFVLLFFCLGNA